MEKHVIIDQSKNLEKGSSLCNNDAGLRTREREIAGIAKFTAGEDVSHCSGWGSIHFAAGRDSSTDHDQRKS